MSLWLNVDPLAEKYMNIGSYVFTLNNPVKYIDPDGMSVINGDQERVDTANSNFESKKAEYGAIGTETKAEFKANHTGKEWRDFRDSRKEVGNATKAFNHTALSISNYATVDPVGYNTANTLTYTNMEGRVIPLNIVVQSGEASGHEGGKTSIGMPDVNTGNIPRNKIYTTISIDLDVDSDVLAHELGHGVSIASNPTKFYNLIKSNPDHDCQDSKNRSSTLSITPLLWQANTKQIYTIVQISSKNI